MVDLIYMQELVYETVTLLICKSTYEKLARYITLSQNTKFLYKQDRYIEIRSD